MPTVVINSTENNLLTCRFFMFFTWDTYSGGQNENKLGGTFAAQFPIPGYFAISSGMRRRDAAKHFQWKH